MIEMLTKERAEFHGQVRRLRPSRHLAQTTAEAVPADLRWRREKGLRRIAQFGDACWTKRVFRQISSKRDGVSCEKLPERRAEACSSGIQRRAEDLKAYAQLGVERISARPADLPKTNPQQLERSRSVQLLIPADETRPQQEGPVRSCGALSTEQPNPACSSNCFSLQMTQVGDRRATRTAFCALRVINRALQCMHMLATTAILRPAFFLACAPFCNRIAFPWCQCVK